MSTPLPELRHAFLGWLKSGGGPRTAPAGGSHPSDGSSPQLDSTRLDSSSGPDGHAPGSSPSSPRHTAGELVYALWDDPTPLSAEMVRALGLPSAVTVAEMARLLYLRWDGGDASSLDEARVQVWALPAPEIASELVKVRGGHRQGRGVATA